MSINFDFFLNFLNWYSNPYSKNKFFFCILKYLIGNLQEICTFGIEKDNLKDTPVPNPYFETALPNQLNNTYPCPPSPFGLDGNPKPNETQIQNLIPYI